MVKTPGLGWWYGPASWGRVGQLGQTWCMELAHQIWACVDPLVRPGLRGYVDTPVGLLRLGGRRSVITLVSSPWRFCVSVKPWLRHLVVARTRHSSPAAHQIHRIAAFLAEVYKHILRCYRDSCAKKAAALSLNSNPPSSLHPASACKRLFSAT